MQAVIMAGGKGTRLSSVTNNEIPKPMVKLNGKPILEYQIECFKANGITNVYIVIGYLGEIIKDYFGDGSHWGIKIEYIIEREPLGTAGALYYLKNKVEETFLLTFGDLIFDFYYERFLQFHKEKGADITLLVHPNSHPYDSDVLTLDRDNRVIGCLFKNEVRVEDYRNIVNAGIYILQRDVLNILHKPVKMDMEKDIVLKLIEEDKKVFGYYTTEYVKDVGTPERLFTTEADIRTGTVAARNLSKKQKCVFIDRDGTINRYVGLLSSKENFELEKNVCEAVKELNQSSYLVVVVTNQPVIARNLCSIDELEEIHKKMETLLGEQHAYLDAIEYCPHHPDKGYPEENTSFKVDCECRKPKIGLITKVAEQYNLDLDKSWMIGDTTIDIQTGINAGIRTILVKTGVAGQDGKYDVKAMYECEDLLEAVEMILEMEEVD